MGDMSGNNRTPYRIVILKAKVPYGTAVLHPDVSTSDSSPLDNTSASKKSTFGKFWKEIEYQ
jgi:hypothetical protein